MFIKASYCFLEHMRVVKQASEHTLRNYTIDLNLFKNYLENHVFHLEVVDKIDSNQRYSERNSSNDNHLSLDNLNRKIIRGFLAWLSENKQNKRTIARRLSSLRSFFKYSHAQKLIEINPTEDLESPKLDKKIPIYLSYNQIEHLFAQPDTTTFFGYRDRAIMELFYSSGLRVSELAGLNRHDFDAGQMTVRLRGKGKKERVVPITKNAATWISGYLNHPERHLHTNEHAPQIDGEAIFLNKHGTRLTVRSIDRNFELYMVKSGLAGKATPHTIRHTIATHWLENGMDLKTIQLILGHQSLTTTTIYTQVTNKLKKKVYDETHPRA